MVTSARCRKNPSIAVDGPGERVFVTHLTSGFVSLLDAPLDGQPPVVTDVLANLFAPTTSGLRGATGIAVREPGDPNGYTYATSRIESRVATMRVVDGAPIDDVATNVLVPGPAFFLYTDSAQGVPNDARTIAFARNGDRAFILNRTPPMVLAYDTSKDLSGQPRNLYLGSTEVCQSPSGSPSRRAVIAAGSAASPAARCGRSTSIVSRSSAPPIPAADRRASPSRRCTRRSTSPTTPRTPSRSSIPRPA